MTSISDLQAKRDRTMAAIETAMRERLTVERALTKLEAEMQSLRDHRTYMEALDPRRKPEQGIADIDARMAPLEKHHADLSRHLAVLDTTQTTAAADLEAVQAEMIAAGSRR